MVSCFVSAGGVWKDWLSMPGRPCNNAGVSTESCSCGLLPSAGDGDVSPPAPSPFLLRRFDDDRFDFGDLRIEDLNEP